MSKYDENKQLRCSFCGKPQSQVARLVAGPDVYICDECIAICLDILKEGAEAEGQPVAGQSEGYKLPKPREISEILSDDIKNVIEKINEICNVASYFILSLSKSGGI